MNDKEIKEVIIKNKGLIGRVALNAYRRYRGTVLDYDDFYQEGIIIAMKYLKNYNPKIAKVSTYIDDCVWKALTRYGESNAFTCKVPAWIGSKSHKYYAYKGELEKRGKCINTKRVARFFKVSRTTANTIIMALNGTNTSYYDLSEETDLYFGTSKDELENKTDVNITVSYVKSKINKLPDKEKFVLKERIYNNSTFEIIGNKIGTSKQYAQMLEASAKKRLKKFIMKDVNNKEVLF